MKKALEEMYKKLYARFGPQHWWPGDTPFEVAVGAILTQNTNWRNVEKAIRNLRKERVLSPRKLYALGYKKLCEFIRPAGYYNIKSRRLKEFLKFFFRAYRGDIKRMRLADMWQLRCQLLAVKGIGPETADSILLYALDKPVFVIDTYTKRILKRHNFIGEDAAYQEVQNLFMQNLKSDVKLFNEYHALLVKLGKDLCLKNRPRCDICPLKSRRTYA